MKVGKEFCLRQRWGGLLSDARMLVVMVGFALPVGALAAAYQAGMGNARWQVKSSVFECSLSQDLPGYGRARLVQRAGEAPGLQLQGPSAVRSGSAVVLSTPPLWRPHGKSHPLARVELKTGSQVLAVQGGILDQLVDELLAGQEVVFSGALGQRAEEARVAITPVDFRRAHQQYQQCLVRLLPVNFDQIRRTALYFPSGSNELPKGDLAKLDRLARYFAADNNIQAFYVDGHSDGAGDRRTNLELSQRRAEIVVGLLLERGIPLDRITTRWHGERYPVASNHTAAGQAKNRRVTVRLERVPAPPLPAASPPAPAPAPVPATVPATSPADRPAGKASGGSGSKPVRPSVPGKVKEGRLYEQARSVPPSVEVGEPDERQEQARAEVDLRESAAWWQP